MAPRINLNLVNPDSDVVVDAGADLMRSRVVAPVEMFVDHLGSRLVDKISRADFVVGCMAWLTQRNVLAALADVKHGCQIVIQKEDFIRPGAVGRQELHAMYGRLKTQDRYRLPFPGNALSYNSDPSCDPIRCMGMVASRPGETIPRMHHKFFVFCKEGEPRDADDLVPLAACDDRASQESSEYGFPSLIPYAVWTGSFNATENATLSRENAIYIEDAAAARFYAAEWARVLGVSEPLDWSSRFIDADAGWRFGS